MFSYVLISSFIGWSKTFLPSILTLQSLISTFGREYRICLVWSSSFSIDNTNNLFTPWSKFRFSAVKFFILS